MKKIFLTFSIFILTIITSFGQSTKFEGIFRCSNEDIVRLISSKKEEPQWLLDYRLNALSLWSTMKEPSWAHVKYKKPDFQAIAYYSAPKQTKKYDVRRKTSGSCRNRSC